jgi:Tetratricopeptide repeat
MNSAPETLNFVLSLVNGILTARPRYCPVGVAFLGTGPMRETILGVVLALSMASAGPAAAGQDDAPTVGRDADGNNFLFLPGIGKIPLPPGARGLPGAEGLDPGEGATPRRQGPRAAAPPPPLSPEERRAQEMEALFARLGAAEDAREAQGAAAAILRRWSQSGSDTIDLLAARAFAAEAGGGAGLARALLDYVVALSPYWPDGFVRRARVKVAEGDDAGALADLETAARLEPRRFDALAALAALAEKTGEKKRALDAYRKALSITPNDQALQKNEERLRIEVEGRGI